MKQPRRSKKSASGSANTPQRTLSAPDPRRVTRAPLEGAPLYERCVAALMPEIATISPGSRLASERLLAEYVGFTRLTVRRALQFLAATGVIEPAPSRGWRVRTSPLSEPPNTLMGFTEMAKARGLVAAARVLDERIRAAGVEEAERLRIAPGTAVVDVVRLRLLDEQPVAIERLILPLSRFKWPADFDFRRSVHGALDAIGLSPSRGEALVDVVGATLEDAKLLDVAVGRGLLRVQCLTSTQDQIPISLDTVRYHPDRYRFRATLERRGGSIGK